MSTTTVGTQPNAQTKTEQVQCPVGCAPSKQNFWGVIREHSATISAIATAVSVAFIIYMNRDKL